MNVTIIAARHGQGTLPDYDTCTSITLPRAAGHAPAARSIPLVRILALNSLLEVILGGEII